MAENESAAGTSNIFPMMPSQESEEQPADAAYADDQTEETEELPPSDEAVLENTTMTEDDEPTLGCEKSATPMDP